MGIFLIIPKRLSSAMINVLLEGFLSNVFIQ